MTEIVRCSADPPALPASSVPITNQMEKARELHFGAVAMNPRGLSRVEAAVYIGVSPSLFDAMVKDGRMPQPKRINSRAVWDRRRVDDAFEALPDGTYSNPWDRDVQ
jgi:predicted DNA-binding transcriptional regulator AlpA